MWGFQLTVTKAGGTINTKGLPLFFLIAAVFFSGCRGREFKPNAKFIDLYVELKLATVAYGNDLEKVNEIRRVILAQHHEKPSTFHQEYLRLVAHPEAWRAFQEDVIKKVESFQATHPKDGKDGKDAKDGVGAEHKVSDIIKNQKDK